MENILLSILLLGLGCWAHSEAAAGSQRPDVRIVNGREARDGEFPYQLSLRRQTIHICGAAILDGNWAISAAHCIDGHEKQPEEFTLRLGSVKRSSGGSIMSVRKIYKHPTYNPKDMNNDVALLRTSPNALSGISNVSPIRLPDVADPITENMPVIVSGWGHMSTADQILSSVLKYTTVLTVNQEKCHDDLINHGGVTEAMFCAAARNTDACQGDSGGPISSNGVLIGIVSWGVGCADPYYPGVYTRLAYPTIRRWIRLLTKL